MGVGFCVNRVMAAALHWYAKKSFGKQDRMKELQLKISSVHSFPNGGSAPGEQVAFGAVQAACRLSCPSIQ